jgi:shikimate kinase
VNELLKGLNVFLIGMMGAGKTTVGNALARQLGYSFVDTDSVIQQVAGKTINQIFAEEGEEQFRQLETEVLAQLSAHTRLTIATGGGIVMRRSNWSYLHHGLVVWLDAPVNLLIVRLQGDTTRPLLGDSNPTQALQTLLEERKHLYAQADLHIHISVEDTPEHLASCIMAEIPTVLKPPTMPPSVSNKEISH